MVSAPPPSGKGPAQGAIRVAFADDSLLMREALDNVLGAVSAIKTVAQGGSMIDPKVVEALIAEGHRTECSRLAQLTPRELEILGFVAGGRNNQAIADELVVTKRAVEKHINEIFRKLDLNAVPDISQRVKAALIYLAETSVPATPPP